MTFESSSRSLPFFASSETVNGQSASVDSRASSSMLIAEDNRAEERETRGREGASASGGAAIINEYKRRRWPHIPLSRARLRVRERRSFIIRFCWVTSTRPSQRAGHPAPRRRDCEGGGRKGRTKRTRGRREVREHLAGRAMHPSLARFKCERERGRERERQ